jgi:hypothetical protein
MASPRDDDDQDDPLALPLPPHTLLLDGGGFAAGETAASDQPWERSALVLQVVRQQIQELGLGLTLREEPAGPLSAIVDRFPGASLAAGLDAAPQSDRLRSDQPPIGEPRSSQPLAAAESQLPGMAMPPGGGDGRTFALHGFRVRLQCAPFWAEELAVPPLPWRDGRRSPQLLLGAWVDEESGAVRLPGVLTAAELLQRCPGLAAGQEPRHLPPAAFSGGLDRLFQLVRLLRPEALLPARPAMGVAVRDWLEGVLADGLKALGAELLPPAAGAFRGAALERRPEALATVLIPLALVLGRIEAGPSPAGASERFRLLLRLCGGTDGSEWLEVRLEPDLPGDLLPQRLTLQVGDRAVDTGADGGSGSLEVTVPARGESIVIGLRHGGGSQLELPPLHFASAPS